MELQLKAELIAKEREILLFEREQLQLRREDFRYAQSRLKTNIRNVRSLDISKRHRVEVEWRQPAMAHIQERL